MLVLSELALCMDVIKGLSFCFIIFGRVTNFLSSWQKFGHDDKKLVAMTIGIVAWPIFCHRDKNLVTMTIGIVTWPIFCHRDKNLVTMTIGIVIVTKNWLRWQLELSSWPKFGHDDQKLVSLFHCFRSGVIPSVSTCLRAFNPWEV